MKIVYGFAGTIGSGKSTLAKAFAHSQNIPYISTGGRLREQMKPRGLDHNNRIEIQSFFQSEYKSDYYEFGKVLFSDIDESEPALIVDSLRGKDSYMALLKHFPSHKICVVYCEIDERTSQNRQMLRGDTFIFSQERDSMLVTDFDDLNYFKKTADIIIDTSVDIKSSVSELLDWHMRGVL